MKLTNVTNLPQPIVEAVKAHEHRPFLDNERSVTELLAPPQQRYLTKKHWNKLEEDAADRIWALMGTSIHKILEHHEKVAVVEKQLRMDLEIPALPGKQLILTGRPDRLAIINQPVFVSFKPYGKEDKWVLQDYKLASKWEYILGVAQEKKDQLRMYDHLLRNEGFKVDRLELVFIFRDWSKRDAKIELKRLMSYPSHDRPAPKYPLTQVVIIPVAKWDTETFLKEVSQRFIDHLADPPRQCTHEERWAKDDIYAVKKKGNKTAVRGGLKENQQQADIFIEKQVAINNSNPKKKKLTVADFVVEFRPAESTRCEDYCAVRDFCPQYKAMKEKTDA